MIGTTVSHYRIIDKLGAGGMGEVYRAEDTLLKRQIALKVLPDRYAGNQLRLERFQREAEALAALDHPNIVTIYSVEEAEGIRFLTMQLVHGRRLSDLIPRRGMPIEQIFEIGIQIADALSAAHAAGIVHRDLKPSNIMVSDDGRVRVLDFGLAKLRQEPPSLEDTESSTDTLTLEGHILGTMPYMSPEQLEARELDASSDIFSFGVILSQMATGRLPFHGDTPAALLSSIMRDTPSSVSEIRDGFPQHLDRILHLCLQKDRSRRLQSAQDVRNELQSLREEWVVEGSRSSQVARPTRPIRRTWWWVGGAIALLGVIALAGFFLRPPEPRSPIEIVAVLPFANLTGDPDLEYLSEGISAGLIHKLSEVRGLQLVSRAEAWGQLASHPGLSKVAERLGVTLVVDGDVQKTGESFRVNVSINDPDQGTVLWTESFQPEQVDLFSLQREIAEDLTRFLSLTLTATEQRRLSRDPADSYKAYTLYLDGEKALDRSAQPPDEAGRFLEEAISSFRDAIRMEPGFALAHAGLSQALWKTHHQKGDAAALAQAEAAARVALDLDPELPAAQIAVARLQEGACSNIGSLDDIQRILPGHPRPDDALRELAYGFEQTGELEEASACYEAATKLASGSWSNWNAWASFLIGAGRYEEADEALDHAIELSPSDVTAPRQNRAAIVILKGDFENAISAYERMRPTLSNAIMASNLGTAYYFSDRDDALEKAEVYYRLAAELDSDSPPIQGNLGDLLLKTGRRDEALSRYRQAQAILDRQIGSRPDFEATNFERWRPLAVQRAFYTAKAENCDAAVPMALDLRARLPERARDLHDLAYVFALCDAPEPAVEALERAIELGFSPKLIAREDEFQSLQKLPEFQQLLKSGDADPDR